MTTFKELGLNPDIIRGLDDLGFVEPSPIQDKAIPQILESKKDLVALAQTGTGKTAAFSLPILNQIKADGRELQAIILCPTRELAMQISADIKTYTKYYKGVITTPVYGGERIDIQINSLKRGTNIVVGTPGRVHDLIRRKVLKLQTIKWVVLDEADEMLDMGFKDDLDVILEETPKARQTLLFSATMSKSVSNIAMKYMKESNEISVGEKNVGAKNVSHEYYVVQARDRFEALKRILDSLPGVYGILFCRTRRETQEVADKLKQAGYDTEALHGDIAQTQRTKIMDRFKKKYIRLLVATDVAARGIDVSDLSHVINYNLPDQNEAYTHRTGRTGRASKSGVAVTIVGPRDTRRITDIEKIIGKKVEFKKVPDGQDVCKKQMDEIIAKIENTEEIPAAKDKYFEEFAEKLSKVKKEDLINYFVNDKFSHIIDAYKNARDLNANSKAPNSQRDEIETAALKIGFGKKHGVDVKVIFGFINASRELKGVEIGKISIMPEYTIFAVEKERSEEVKQVLSRTRFKGKNIVVTIVSNDSIAKSTFSRNSGGGGGRRNDGSRNSGGNRRNDRERGDRKSNNNFSGRSGSRKRKAFKKAQ
ncbi:MAG: DEAD/DEAH box helicase [Patescibacteria group bacterium]|jgi:ATP-dependent RNA helicase DeaD|nr:DEAD/DEAH box helicase [Patescibacteria group bacterium]